MEDWSDITQCYDQLLATQKKGGPPHYRPSIFVFGSNLAGRHGKGAALHAKRLCGAVQGQGVGFQGQSYAIPTKGRRLEVLPLEEIAGYVWDFLDFARTHPELTFEVTRVGCGLAGFRDDQMGPLFRGAPGNVRFVEPRWEGYR